MFLLVLVCTAIAAPFTALSMSKWLTSFDRIQVGASSFIYSGLAIMAVALITICYHVIKTALSKPAEVLKYE